ncbi:MAG: helicase-related protein [Candidatus Acidiferrales bacterium]
MKAIEGQNPLFELDEIEADVSDKTQEVRKILPAAEFKAVAKSTKTPKISAPLGISKTPSVTLHKGGGKIVITPNDIMAAISLIEIRERIVALNNPVINASREVLTYQLLPDVTPLDFKHATMAWSLVGKKLKTHPMVRLLDRYGLEVTLSPSLSGWMKKEERRLIREATPFLLPDYKDDRSLFEKVEAGMILTCIKDFTVDKVKLFHKDQRYQVVDTARGGSGGEAQENQEHQDGIVKISKTPITPSAKITLADDTVYLWTVFNGDMEEHFHFEEKIIYEPSKCVPAVYPELVATQQKALDKLGLELYDHVEVDVVQEAIKRNTLNGKLMRMGKFVFSDSKILTPSGWRTMESIKVGDILFGSNGYPDSKVTGVYQQGLQDVYRVTFSDGTSVECGSPHLWEVHTAEDKYSNRPKKIMKTCEIAADLTYSNGNTKYYIPIVQPVRFPKANVPLDSYLVGALLGDGTLGSGSIRFTTADKGMLTKLRNVLPNGVTLHKITGSDYDYAISRINPTDSNPVLDTVRDLGINHEANEKFIPDIYKFGCIEQRKAILAGLLDTDGGTWNQISLNSAPSIEYSSVSEQLCDDVRFLVESLGGVAHKSIKNPTYDYKGEKKVGQIAYKLIINIPFNPFRLKRKKDRYKKHEKYTPVRGITKIENTGERKYAQCISVSADNGLYLLDHCILTHNTSESIVCALLWGSARVAIVAPRNARIFTVKEFERLGIKDFVVVDSMADLQKPAKFYLMTYSWLKKSSDIHRMFRRKGQSSLHRSFTEAKLEKTVYHYCPYCKTPLQRLKIQKTKSQDTGFLLEKVVEWTPDRGYICRNPQCKAKIDFSHNTGAAWSQYIDSVTGKIRKSQPANLGSIAPMWLGPAPSMAKWQATITSLKANLALAETSTEKNKKELVEAAKNQLDWAQRVDDPHQTGEYIGYINWGLRFHKDCHEKSIRGRYCHECHQADAVWVPAPVKRRVTKASGKKVHVKDFFGAAIIDEIHNIKSFDSDTGKAIRSIRSKRRMGLTGTLMPNTPADSFWPLHWVFKGGSAQFPYHQREGATEFYDRFCEYINIKRGHGLKDSRKMLPYLKNPVAFWELMSSKMVRRNYEDPLVQASLAKANRYYPDIEFHRVESVMDPKQAALMVTAINHFETNFNEYANQVAQQGHLLNQAMVVSQMVYLRIGATCPEYFNIKLAKIGQPAIYDGPLGGGKMSDIQNICATKTAAGEKVVVLSDFVEMRKSLAKMLQEHNPIVFDGSWNDDERNENFEAFLEDPTRKIFIAGTRQIREGTNLSAANTVICCDLLWEPGLEMQAISRAFTPTSEKRKVNVYILMAKNSIDEHVYSTFYAKLAAAEQALDRKTINRRAHQVDLRWFVDRVLADRDGLLAYLKEEGETGIMIKDSSFKSIEDREV